MTSRPSRLRPGLVFAAVTLAAFAAPALDPTQAAGLPLPNPVDAVKDLIGGATRIPGDVAGQLGATALKEALEWLIGDLKAVITLDTIKFLTSVDLVVGSTLASVTGPMIVIGGFFLIVGLITSIGDGYREVVAGTDTAPRVMGQAIFRVVGLAVLLGSWFFLIPLAIDVANGMRDYVLSDRDVRDALSKSFQAQALLNTNPLFALLVSIGLVIAMLGLLVIKFVLVIAFAMLYTGGPMLIGFAALPRVGNVPLAIAVRGTLTLMLVPITWTVVFVAWAGVSGGLLDSVRDAGDAVARVMTGPALFLAGLVVIFGVTKKLLSLAAFGLPLVVPGARVLRSAFNSMVLHRIARTATSPAAAVAGAAHSQAWQPQGTTTATDSAPWHPRGDDQRSRPAPARPRRPLQVADRPPEAAAPASPPSPEPDSVLAVGPPGRFGEPSPAPSAAEEAAVRDAIRERRVRGTPSVEQVRDAGRALTAPDRVAFAAEATTAGHWREPEHAQRTYSAAAARQIAAAPQIQPRERDAAITIAAASPDTVREAFRREYEELPSQDRPTAEKYDPDLMRPDGGLERFRRTHEPRGDRPPDDDLPF